jgi:hypothetical protein
VTSPAPDPAALLAETVHAQADDGYRVWSTDLLTGRPLSFDLPIAVSSYLYGKVNSYGSADGDISLDGPDDPLQVLPEKRTCLWIAYRDQVVWGGIVWDLQPDIDSRMMRVTSQTWSSYFEQLLIRDNLIFRNTGGGVDQLDVFRALLAYAQGKSNANIGVQVDPLTSGHLITQLWGPGAGDGARPDKPVSEAMKEIADVDPGFEWADDVGDNGTHNPVKRIRLGYPRLAGSAAGLLLEYPGNISNYTWTSAGKGSPNIVYALGSGDGASTLVEAATDTTQLALGYPRLEYSTGGDHKEITRRATLAAAARADLAALGGSRIAPTFKLVGNSVNPADLAAGNRIRVRLTSGFHRPRPDGSPGFDGYVRITGVKVAPGRADQAGSIEVTTMLDGLA